MSKQHETNGAGFRQDYAAGQRVKITRRDGTESKGTVVKRVKRQTGVFIMVNIGTKDVQILKSVRPAWVRAY